MTSCNARPTVTFPTAEYWLLSRYSFSVPLRVGSWVWAWLCSYIQSCLICLPNGLFLSYISSLQTIRWSLTSDAIRALVQAFMSCRQDYCNSLLAVVAGVHPRRLPSVQNAADRLVSGTHRYDHIMSVFRALDWQHFDRQILLCARSSVSSRPICSSTKKSAADSCVVSLVCHRHFVTVSARRRLQMLPSQLVTCDELTF